MVQENSAYSDWNEGNLTEIVSHYLLTGTCLLSPYPKSYDDNMAWRLDLLRKADKDEVFRQKLKRLFFSDPLFAFNAFFYTLDVRQRPQHHQPFATYPYQDLVINTLIGHIESGRDLAVEKSRDMGLSWLVIGCYVWLWLQPKGGYDFLLGSRIEDYVDKKGDMRTLFEKARYILSRLPWWLMPKGWNTKKHDNYMKLMNPETMSSITGESNNANFSTGGRYKSILLDEFAKWKETDKAAWTATADASPSRIPVSTPFGAFGQYFTTISDGQTDKLTAHWSLHPKKSEGLYCVWPKPEDLAEGRNIDWFNWKGTKAWLRSPWYDKECLRRDQRTVSQELDIDYIGAGCPAFTGQAATRLIELIRSPRKPLALYDFTPDYKLVELPLTEQIDFEGKLVVYSLPTATSLEVLAVDVVEGKENGDYASIKALDRKSRSCSFSYYSRVDEVILSYIIEAINNWLCSLKADASLEPWIAIETNGPGLSTFDLCVEHGVTNLFLTPNYDSVKEAIVYQKGWKTTSSSRKKLVSAIKEWLIEGKGWVDSRCSGEMTSFVYVSPNRPEAAGDSHDDEVIAWGIALAVDEILPGAEWEAPLQPISSGISLTTNIVDLSSLKTDEPTSIEERCFLHAQERQEARISPYV